MFTTRQRKVWSVGALLVPVLLAAAGVLWQGRQIEQGLGHAVADAVDVAADRVAVDGRDVTVRDVAPRAAARVREVVAAVPGVGAVTVREAEPGELLFFVRADEIVLAGTTADAAETRELVDAVRARAGAHRITPVLTEGTGTRLPVEVPVAAALVGAVVANGVHGFSGVVRGDAVTVLATVVDQPRVQVLRDALAAAAGGLRLEAVIAVGASAGP